MNRNWCTDAQVLAVKKNGEDNRIITVLTKDKGLIQAMLYGGPKSKLRALVSPYHYGKMWLYTDAVKHSTKITDFDVTAYRCELRESLFKTCAAGLCAELTVKTHSGTEFEETWLYVSSFLDGLCKVTDEEARVALLRYIWRHLHVMGLQPDPCHCAHCGQNVCTTGNIQKIFYSLHESSFYCPDCSSYNSDNPGFLLSNQSVNYLSAITTQSPGYVRSLSLNYDSIQELQDFLVTLLQNFVEGKLQSLDILLRF